MDQCFRMVNIMDDFDNVTDREEFDSTMAKTVFSDRSGGQGCFVLRRLLEGGEGSGWDHQRPALDTSNKDSFAATLEIENPF